MPDDILAPDVALATEIVDTLISAGLVPLARKEQIKTKMLSGIASEGDWRSWVYTALLEKEREEVQTDAEEAH